MIDQEREEDSMFFNKKGNLVYDLMVVFIGLFILTIFIFSLQKAQVDVNAMVQNDTDMVNESKAIMQDNTTAFPSIWDNGYVVLLSFFWILMIVSSFMIDNHPIFFGIMIIVVIIAMIIPAVLANTYEEIAEDSNFVTIADEFPKINWIFNHYVQIWLVLAFSVAIPLFVKLRN